MLWYKGELLNLAFDLGYRLLPAFNTSTGIPHSKVNLMHGLRSQKLSNSKETCTACAGTMILEFAALSRLTGDPIFEEKAHKGISIMNEWYTSSLMVVHTICNIKFFSHGRVVVFTTPQLRFDGNGNKISSAANEQVQQLQFICWFIRCSTSTTVTGPAGIRVLAQASTRTTSTVSKLTSCWATTGIWSDSTVTIRPL